MHRPVDLATLAARGVRSPAPEALPNGERSTPSAEPLYQTSVFDFADVESSEGPLRGEGDGYSYARIRHPNGRSLELTVAALEGAQDALATSSGMSALGCALLAGATTGDRVLCQDDAYGGTRSLLDNHLARFGVTVEYVRATDPACVAAALDRPARVLLVETLSNPLLREVDLPALAALCHARGVLLLVDNTFATPILRRPHEQGADLVIHSATKFLGGHHDLTAGVLAGSHTLISAARSLSIALGVQAAPLDAWLACRGIRTLDLRMKRAEETARALAARLRADVRVRAVHFPGWGTLVSFELDGDAAARRTVRALAPIELTPSLGGTATGVSHPATSSHRDMAPEARRALGIADGLLRLSVGLETETDLWADLDHALGA